jgi:outer membrane murein-binding lipoprotein Lpp
VGLGLACLVAVGALAGVLLAGGDDSSPGDEGRSQAQTRQAQQLRAATRADLEQAGTELSEARDEAGRAQRRGAGQRARAESWRRRAQRLERRNRALRRALAQAQRE